MAPLRVAVRYFKSVEHLELELAPLTLLVGPPASGKSNILEAVALAGYLARFAVLDEEYGGSPAQVGPLLSTVVRGGLDEAFYFGEKHRAIEVSVRAGEGEEFTVRVTPSSAELIHGGRRTPLPQLVKLLRGQVLGPQEAQVLREAVKGLRFDARLYGFDRYGLSKTFTGYLVQTGAPHPRTILREDALNARVVTPVLRRLSLELNRWLRERVGVKVELKWLRDGRLVVFDYEHEVPPGLLSDALSRLLYYLAALRTALNYAATHGVELVVMMEEPEAHVFPYAFELLVSSIKEAVDHGVRVVITTHDGIFASTLLTKIDGSIYYVYRDETGSTRATPISVEKLLEDFVAVDELLAMPVREVLKYAAGERGR